MVAEPGAWQVEAELAAWDRYLDALWAMRQRTGQLWPAGWQETANAARLEQETEWQGRLGI